MRKIGIFVLFLIFIFGFVHSEECELSKKHNYVISKVENLIIKKAEKKGRSFLVKTENILKKIENNRKLSSSEKCIFGEIYKIIDKQKRYLLRKKNLKKYQKWYKNVYKEKKEVKNVNMKKVRNKWLERTNEARRKKGLREYNYVDILNRTAYLHSKNMLTKHELIHKREGATGYNYDVLDKWFDKKGVDFVNIGGFTHTENIGAGYIECEDKGKKECNQEVLESLKQSFDEMMAEKNKEYKAHYQSIICPSFSQIGFALKKDELAQKFYFTVHYASRVKGY